MIGLITGLLLRTSLIYILKFVHFQINSFSVDEIINKPINLQEKKQEKLWTIILDFLS